MSSTLTAGRVVVTSDSDLFGDDSITDLDHRQLWLNLVTWAAGSRAALAQQASAQPTWVADDPAWADLVDAVESLRPLQAKDGSVDLTVTDAATVTALVERMCASIEALAPRFPHDADHLAATVADLARGPTAASASPTSSTPSPLPPRPHARGRPASTWSSSRCTRRTATPTATSRPS